MSKELNKYIDEGINALVEIQGAKELLSSVVESICEKFGYEKAEANQILAKAYQKKYENEKYEKTKERTEKVYEVVEGSV